jgi:hypothetical protein
LVTISALSTGRRCVGRAGAVTADGVVGQPFPASLDRPWRRRGADIGRTDPGQP